VLRQAERKPKYLLSLDASKILTKEQHMFYTERRNDVKWHKKYAWIPTRVTQNRWVWFSDFYQKETSHSINGKLDSVFIQCYSREDYITMKLTGEA